MLADTKATIVIDGLQDKVQKRVTKSLRQLGIKMRKVVGGRDESSPLLRLTDSLAEIIRESEEEKGDYQKIVNKLSEAGVIVNYKYKKTTVVLRPEGGTT